MHVDLIDIGADTPGQYNILRVINFEGSGHGPNVYLQAALHAQEMPGVAALDQLILKLQTAEQNERLVSKITVVPLANPIGLSQAIFGASLGRFDMNSRTNFNRNFPHELPQNLENSTVVEKLKATLLELATKADIVLDLHCDDEGPVYLYAPDVMLKGAKVLSSALGADIILTYKPGNTRTFDEAVYSHWSKAVGNGTPIDKLVSTIEFRGMMDVSQTYATTDSFNLYEYLIAVGAVLDGQPQFKTNDPLIRDEALAELIPTPVSGAVLYCVDVGDQVSAGQCVAHILSEAGSPHYEILAPSNGIVVTRRDRRFLRKGEDVLKVLRLED